MTPSDSRHSFPVMRLVDESRSKTWSRTFRVSRIVPKNSSEIPQWNMIQISTKSRVLHDNWEKITWTTGHQISNNGECFPAIRVVLTTSFGKSLTNFRYFVATRDSGFPRVGHIWSEIKTQLLIGWPKAFHSSLDLNIVKGYLLKLTKILYFYS